MIQRTIYVLAVSDLDTSLLVKSDPIQLWFIIEDGILMILLILGE